jgi:ElaB/YqjD/DUF883 family membrane-anchored ribosome-binding protein
MEETVDQIKEQAAQARTAYEQGRRAVGDFTRTAAEKSKQAFSLTDDWVHDNTWIALGVVAGVGLLLGVLIAQSLQD